MNHDLNKKTVESDIVLLTPKDIQIIFGIGKNQAYQLMNSASFPTLRLNNRMFVEQEKLKEWLNTYAGRQFLF